MKVCNFEKQWAYLPVLVNFVLLRVKSQLAYNFQTWLDLCILHDDNELLFLCCIATLLRREATILRIGPDYLRAKECKLLEVYFGLIIV